MLQVTPSHTGVPNTQAILCSARNCHLVNRNSFARQKTQTTFCPYRSTCHRVLSHNGRRQNVTCLCSPERLKTTIPAVIRATQRYSLTEYCFLANRTPKSITGIIWRTIKTHTQTSKHQREPRKKKMLVIDDIFGSHEVLETRR